MSTDEIMQAALSLLEDPLLIKRYLAFCHNFYVGRDSELKLLKLSTMSRKFDRGIPVVIIGPSSTGKSLLVQTVLLTVWPEDMENFTRVTPNYLLYRKGDLTNRIITFYELQGTDDALNIIKTMITEGHLRLGTVAKDEMGGLTAREISRPAQGVVVLSTTTADVLDHELDTRVLRIELVHDQSLTREVYRHKASRAAHPARQCAVDGEPAFAADSHNGATISSSAHQKEAMIFQAADHMLEACDVAIPYAPKIAELFPTDQERYHRDFEKVLQLIRSSALLHSYQRPRDEDGRIVAGRGDYELVYELRDLLNVSKTSAPAYVLTFLEAIKGCGGKSQPPAREEVQAQLNISLATVKRYVHACLQNEWIAVQGTGNQQKLILADEPSAKSFLPNPKGIFEEAGS